MKKLVLAAMSCAVVLGLQHPAQAAWVTKSCPGVGLSIKVNDTFKVTKDSKTEADLEGTIYKHDAIIFMMKDSSRDWSQLSDQQILSFLIKGGSHNINNFKVVDQGKAGIGDAEGRYAAFDATIDGHDVHGYMNFAVVEGDIYNVLMFYEAADDKTDDVASKMVDSADFLK